jgi:N-methylhydantoinase B
VLKSGSAAKRALTSKVAGLLLKHGDLLSVEFAGGGGCGDPYERDVHRVREDVARGYVSLGAAREDYGVALDSSLTIDSQATALLRQKKTHR